MYEKNFTKQNSVVYCLTKFFNLQLVECQGASRNLNFLLFLSFYGGFV